MRKKPNEHRTYAQKIERANREALYSVVALLVIVVAWWVGGFGLAGLDVEFFSTPLWIIGGTVGTWLVAVVVAIVLAKRVFVNFDLDDVPSEDEAYSADGTDQPTREGGVL